MQSPDELIEAAKQALGKPCVVCTKPADDVLTQFLDDNHPEFPGTTMMFPCCSHCKDTRSMDEINQHCVFALEAVKQNNSNCSDGWTSHSQRPSLDPGFVH